MVIGYGIGEYRAAQSEFDRLAVAKDIAGQKQFDNKGKGIEWFGKQFVVSAKGAQGYEWVLSNGDVTICLAKTPKGGRIMPEVYVTFRSEYLWGRGYKRAYESFKDWLSAWAVVVGEKISRCDLCVDLAMPPPEIDLKQEAVTRARLKTSHLEASLHSSGRQITGYRLGSGDLLCRIYDKTAEVKKSQKEWFREIWRGQGWDGLSPITRCEFQLRRGILKDFGVNFLSELTERLADIWRYCTEDWLTIREINGTDAKRCRWRITDFWRLIQSAVSHFGTCLGILRYKQKQCNAEHLEKQLKGVLVSLLATNGLVYGDYAAKRDLKTKLTKWFDDSEVSGAVRERQAKIAQMSG